MKIYNIKNENEYEEYPPLDMEDDIYGVSASAYDCTGLMPTPPEDEAQREAYGDVYPYLPEEE
ncbi:MAG: hypothetical protein IJT79_03620 [Ruminococcus sp.]|nr:hypothetical protein [Ruminococcus sp.]